MILKNLNQRINLLFVKNMNFCNVLKTPEKFRGTKILSISKKTKSKTRGKKQDKNSSNKHKKKSAPLRVVPISKKNGFMSKKIKEKKNVEKPVPRAQKPKNIEFVDMSEGYNIFYIDEKIREKMEYDISTVDELQNDLEILLKILSKSDNRVNDLKTKQKASMMRRRIQDLETTFLYGFYILETNNILKQYRYHAARIIKVSFCSFNDKFDENQHECNKLEKQYISIAKKYIDIENIEKTNEVMTCKSCNSIKFIVCESTLYTCENCGEMIEILDENPTFHDGNRVNLCSRYTYNKKGHFEDTLKEYQAKQNTSIPPYIFEDIKIWCGHHGISLDKEKIEKVGVNFLTKDHLYMFLNEKKYPRENHYKNINLIHYKLTNVLPPNITSLEKVLLDKYDKYEETYEIVKDSERKNSLNVWYVLFKFLEHESFKCVKEDFYILKTRSKLEEHDSVWKKICKVNEWTYYPTI